MNFFHCLFRAAILPGLVFGGLLPSFAGNASDASQPGRSPPRPVSRPLNNCLTPDYPALARLLGASGLTRVRFRVSPAGLPTDIAVVQASGDSFGNRLLDEAAVTAIAECRFGEAEGFGPARFIQPFEWKLLDP